MRAYIEDEFVNADKRFENHVSRNPGKTRWKTLKALLMDDQRSLKKWAMPLDLDAEITVAIK